MGEEIVTDNEMNKWRECRLGQLVDEKKADLQTGPFGTMLNSSEYTPVGVPVIAVQDIGENRLNHSKFVYVSENTVSRLSKYQVVEGDIIFGRKGAVDRRARIRRSEEGWLQGSDCIRVRFDSSIDATFISYQFGSSSYREWMLQNSTGATMPSLNQQVLKLLPIILPPLPEQKAIAQVLSSLDDKIDLLHRQNKTLEAIAETLFRQWFIEEAQDDWEEDVLGSFIDILDSQRVPLSKMERQQRKDGTLYPYYGAAQIMDYINDYIFDGEYILLGEDGTVKTDEGYPVLQYATGKFWVNNHAHVIKAKAPFSNFFLWNYLSKQSVNGIVTGAVQPKINQGNLKSLSFPRFPESLVHRFNKVTEPMSAKINRNKTHATSLKKLRDTLLPKLMSGEVRVEL